MLGNINENCFHWYRVKAFSHSHWCSEEFGAFCGSNRIALALLVGGMYRLLTKDTWLFVPLFFFLCLRQAFNLQSVFRLMAGIAGYHILYPSQWSGLCLTTDFSSEPSPSPAVWAFITSSPIVSYISLLILLQQPPTVSPVVTGLGLIRHISFRPPLGNNKDS